MRVVGCVGGCVRVSVSECECEYEWGGVCGVWCGCVGVGGMSGVCECE